MATKDGDWVVIHNFGIECHRVIKVTQKLIFYKSRMSNHEYRLRPDDVLFSSDNEAVAKLVTDQLTSSRALYNEERIKSERRKVERDKHIIACGNATKIKAA